MQYVDRLVVVYTRSARDVSVSRETQGEWAACIRLEPLAVVVDALSVLVAWEVRHGQFRGRVGGSEEACRVLMLRVYFPSAYHVLFWAFRQSL